MTPFECIQLIRRARIAGMEGHPDLARQTLLEAAEKFPGEITPRTALWEFHVRFGLSDELATRVRAEMASIISSRPPGAATLSYLSRAPEMEVKELEIILAAAESRLREAPADRSLLESVAVLHQRLGQFEGARDSFRRLAVLDGTVESTWQTILLDQELEDWDGLARDLAQVMKTEARNPFVQLAYIEALGRSGRHDELIQHVDAARRDESLDLGWALPVILVQSAWEMRDRGRDPEAELLFRKALEIDPGQIRARNALLYLYTPPEEQAAQAETSRRELLAAAETDPIEIINQGASLLAAGDNEGAYELTRRALEIIPDEEIGWFNLGIICTNLERWEEAAAALGRAVSLNPSRPQTHYLLGQALQQSERFAEAIEAYLKALALAPERTEINYFLHLCYLQTGQDDLARKALAAFQAAAE